MGALSRSEARLAGEKSNMLVAIPLAIAYEFWSSQLLSDMTAIAAILCSLVSDREAVSFVSFRGIDVLTLFFPADPDCFLRLSSRHRSGFLPLGPTGSPDAPSGLGLEVGVFRE